MASEPSRCWDVGKRTSTTRMLMILLMSGLYGRLCLVPQAFNAQVHGLPGAQVHRRFLPQSYAGWCAGGDDVAGLQAHEAAQVANQESHAVDHGGGAAVLIAFAIHFQPQFQGLWVRHFVGSDQPGAGRAKGVAALALVPGAAAIELEFAF